MWQRRLGCALTLPIASGKAGFELSGGLASNGYAEHSPEGYSMLAALITEVAMTFIFLIIILGATDSRAPRGFAPIAGAVLAGIFSRVFAECRP